MLLPLIHENRCLSGKKLKHFMGTLKILLSSLIIVLSTAILLSLSNSAKPSVTPQSLFTKSSEHQVVDESSNLTHRRSDIFTGEWIPNLEAPYYTNETCWAIHDQQNCMKHGRPDKNYLKWRWKPDNGQLPIFNPVQFLELVRGKSMAFVGDSVARNQMQSLICLLSRVEYPKDVSSRDHVELTRGYYTSYNFTLVNIWSPYWVKYEKVERTGSSIGNLFHLYLDELEEGWTRKISEFDYVIISAGHWFALPAVFYKNRQRIGCHSCQLENVPDQTTFGAYQMAIRSTFRALNDIENYKGITYLRTFSPSHFENGTWNQGGYCHRTGPYKRNETNLEGDSLKYYMIQIEELKKAKEEGEKKGLKYRLLDITHAMLLRPDGHPDIYGHWVHDERILHNDCLHWCLPGPIDTWNDFLLYMIKMESKS